MRLRRQGVESCLIRSCLKASAPQFRDYIFSELKFTRITEHVLIFKSHIIKAMLFIVVVQRELKYNCLYYLVGEEFAVGATFSLYS